MIHMTEYSQKQHLLQQLSAALPHLAVTANQAQPPHRYIKHKKISNLTQIDIT
jgi:hypothetical protein